MKGLSCVSESSAAGSLKLSLTQVVEADPTFLAYSVNLEIPIILRVISKCFKNLTN